tara:strand:- start:601 stop:999 length:399 start_codon:yes stop_codon:yes gene_type:complete
MKKTKNNELEKDDEILRIQAMEDGEKLILGKKMRPVSALSVSWMQRNNVFAETRDLIWKASAFAYLHCEDFSKIRAVINNQSSFTDAVDVWIEKNVVHHFEINAIADAMNKAFQVYMSSASSKEGTGSGSGN